LEEVGAAQAAEVIAPREFRVSGREIRSTSSPIHQQRAFARKPMDGPMSQIPDNADALLKREAAAAALTAAGYPVSPRTLATKATRGGGPPYSLFSGRALYRWGDALDWARSLTTPPRRSTSEADAHAGR
jgi:hypothetical protein